MPEYLEQIFLRMIGTLAVILVIAAFIGSSDIFSKFMKTGKRGKWTFTLLTGVLGGVFGIYGNISGFDMGGVVISVRDMGPMLSGFLGGPVGGLLAGVIAGAHRLTMGGETANACVVATCSIGLMCGVISRLRRSFIAKPLGALIVSAGMETFHLGVVLLMVKPFEHALEIVREIALPFIAVNTVGFVMMIGIMAYTEKQRSISLERNRLKSELEVANVIQHSLLPLLGESYPGRSEVDVSASMEAAKEVGGDFYDVFFFDSDHIAFVIGDVSGKGVPAAMFMAVAKIVIQNCVRDIPDLAQAAGTANNVLCSRNDAEMFVTIWVGVLDLRTGELKYVCAGHNPPVILSGGGASFVKTKNGFVMAGMENVKYRANTLTLGDGDTVFLYTDGVTEAGNAKHELYGEERLLGCVASCAGEAPGDVIKKVSDSVDSFAAGSSQFDDITMLCFRFNRPEDAS